MKRENGNHWTRLCTLILALLMVFALGMTVSAAETEPEEPECYTQGDMNTDGAVDGSDAIYTLYRSLFGDQFYPVNQGWDFNGDGKMDNQDAIYLLYASLFPSDYHLDGVVHSYYDPSWKWSDDLTAVEVTFKCGCGQETVFSSEEKDSGVKLTEKVLAEPTCTAPGAVEYTATVTVDGQTYTSVKTGSVPALAEHQWKDDVKPDCEHSGECVLCGYKQEATGHKWELADTTEATCYDDAVEHYACGTCGETKDVELAGTAGHQYVAMETPKLIDEETCTYADSWCAVCQALNEEKTIVLHQYEAVVLQEATCTAAGRKVYTCRCGEQQKDQDGEVIQVTIPQNADHTWEEHDDGTGATHWCTVCHTTKTVVKAEEGKVDMSEHDSAVEVELGNDTTISLDADTAAGLEGQVQITVTETDKDDTGLTEEQKEQIPGDTVYDFNMKDANGDPITEFDGSVTISLPYTLAEGEDVDSIDIWYINDKGEPVRVEDAVYNNGFVTFTTTHFSYYTVTRLTPAERCGLYGHIEKEYTKAATCTKCDYSHMEEAEIYYDCQAWTVGKEILHDGTGICGQIILEHRSCPCGQESRTNISTSCSLNWVEDVDNTEYFKCPVCETQMIKEYEIVREQGSCTATTMANVSIIVNGETIGTYEESWSWTEHSLVSTFEGSCEEGYYVTESCVRCDYSYREEELRTGHDRRRVEYIDLSEYGLCGGTIERYSCACGLQSHIQWGDSCQWQSTELYDEEHQVWADYCPVCNTYRYHRISGERDPETCMCTENWWIKLVRNGETVLEKTYIRSYESHDSLAVGFIMNVEGGTCEDGYTVIWECKDCGHVTQHEDYGHYTFRTKTLVLSEECGAEIWWSSCPCGQETNISYNTCPMSGHYWEEVAEDGLLHGYFEMSCEKCGLVRYEDWRYVPTGEACQYDSYGTITFMMDGTVLATVQETGGITRHDHQVIGMTLMEGADSCDEGVTVTYQCQGCGDTYEDKQYYHEQMLVEEIDLAPYGAVCGGTLKLYRCACGRESYYEFTKCDMDCKSVDHWIDGVIDENGQDTSEGYQWYNSQSWMLTCAVTDPEACALKIRMAEVWLADGCTATRYQIWQLGYDETTDTCQKEITIVLETRAYHNYMNENINETLEDGTNVHGTKYTCTVCGSTYTEQYYYQNDQHVKTECIAINTLDNGENKKLTYLYEYDACTTGTDGHEYRLRTRSYDEYVWADGTVYWCQCVYTYDEAFAADCTCTVTYTNSDGSYEVRTENCHNYLHNEEVILDSTCTQDGYWSWENVCVFCGHVIDSGSHALEPIAHSWSWNEEMQTYVCMECGLESINGASGAIVLEDLSDDTDYVVGYWNRGNVEYLVNVSVILYDVAEGQEDQLVLSGITFSQREDVRAVSCSKSDVQAAAAAAMADADYTDSYAIRISFVPTNSTDELDYAITFDAQKEQV